MAFIIPAAASSAKRGSGLWEEHLGRRAGLLVSRDALSQRLAMERIGTFIGPTPITR